MRLPRESLADVLLALEPGGERPCWHGQGPLPLSVRISERLGDMLTAASELRVELEREEAAPLAWIVPEIDGVIGRIDNLLQRLAS